MMPLYGIRCAIEAVADEYRLSRDDLVGPRRTKDMVVPRHVAMWVSLRQCPRPSLTEIGRAFGGRDHTTVRSAVENVERERSANTEFRRLTDRLRVEVARAAGMAVFIRHAPDDVPFRTRRADPITPGAMREIPAPSPATGGASASPILWCPEETGVQCEMSSPSAAQAVQRKSDMRAVRGGCSPQAAEHRGNVGTHPGPGRSGASIESDRLPSIGCRSDARAGSASRSREDLRALSINRQITST